MEVELSNEEIELLIAGLNCRHERAFDYPEHVEIVEMLQKLENLQKTTEDAS